MKGKNVDIRKERTEREMQERLMREDKLGLKLPDPLPSGINQLSASAMRDNLEKTFHARRMKKLEATICLLNQDLPEVADRISHVTAFRQREYQKIAAQIVYKNSQLMNGMLLEVNKNNAHGKKNKHELIAEVKDLQSQLQEIVTDAGWWGIKEEDLK